MTCDVKQNCGIRSLPAEERKQTDARKKQIRSTIAPSIKEQSKHYI